MSESTSIKDLVSAIKSVQRSLQFCCSGVVSISNPGLSIDGVNNVKMPVSPKDVMSLSAAAEQAPYGKGTKTIVDKKVRNTLEVDAKRLTLSDTWNKAIETELGNIAEGLGLPPDRLQAELYKLLIYEKGGFFLPHRDSEKSKRMVASLIVMLPSSFDGGQLMITHTSEQETFWFHEARAGKAAEYVAFYADCQHEVSRVTRGVRICLAYNLSLKPERKRKITTTTDSAGSESELAAAINSWVQSRPGEPMVFAMEHQYTASGLKPDLLKGTDRAVAKQLIDAAAETGCRVHFGQVSRHLLQFADDGSYGRQRHYRSRAVEVSKLTLGEVFEDEVTIDSWKDSTGKGVSFDSLPLDRSMLVSQVPLELWKPTREDYEGYNGNAGNTLDRWYHKSAIVIWSEKHHFDVLVQMGMHTSIETFLSMRLKLTKTSAKKLEQACLDCESLARAIIAHWPSRRIAHFDQGKEDEIWLEDFSVELPKLDDLELVGEFANVIAQRDSKLSLEKFVVDTCRRFGADAMMPKLMDILTYTKAVPSPRAPSVSTFHLRDAVWLCKLACDTKLAKVNREQWIRLCEIAIQRYIQRITQEKDRYDVKSWSGKAFSKLLQSAVALEHETSMRTLLDCIRLLPQLFDKQSFQVRACKDIIEWSDKRLSVRPQPLNEWLTSIHAT